MTLQEEATIKFLIQISLLKVYKVEKICGSVVGKKRQDYKVFLSDRKFEDNV